MGAAARINKRPLHRPAVPSPYTSSGKSKTVYVSAKTPFMSAVKRVDKILNLAEKRDVQSATATVRQDNPRKRQKLNGNQSDEITSIAQTLNERQSREQVIVKATGKAIAKALELGLWFQQRQQYAVKLKTGTVESIDDIEIDEGPDTAHSTLKDPPDEAPVGAVEDSHAGKPEDSQPLKDEVQAASGTSSKLSSFLFNDTGQKDETRIRSVSVIEVYISSR